MGAENRNEQEVLRSDGIALPNFSIDISAHGEKKAEAMKCYTSEVHKFSHPRAIRHLRAVCETWGAKAGCEFAEAFALVREVER